MQLGRDHAYTTPHLCNRRLHATSRDSQTFHHGFSHPVIVYGSDFYIDRPPPDNGTGNLDVQQLARKIARIHQLFISLTPKKKVIRPNMSNHKRRGGAAYRNKIHDGIITKSCPLPDAKISGNPNIYSSPNKTTKPNPRYNNLCLHSYSLQKIFHAQHLE